jgi:hypothetical protein
MALLPATRTHVTSTDVLRVVLIIAALIAVMAVLTLIFGVNSAAPSYQIGPDPAQFLPFG